MTKAKILIVQNDDDGLAACLKDLGYTVCAAVSSARQAAEEAAAARPDLALIDLRLEDGSAAVERIAGRLDVPVVCLTDGSEQCGLRQAEAADHASGYVLRPFEKRQLHLNIQTALSLHDRARRGREAAIKLEQTVHELREQSELMQTTFDSISDGVVVANAEGRFQLFNPCAEEIIGVGMLDAPPEQWTEQYGLFFPDGKTHIPTDQIPLVRALRGEATDGMELIVRNEQRPNGVHLRVSGRPLQGRAPERGGGVVVFQDVTKDKEAEARLQQTMQDLRNQNALMETAFNSIREGIIVADATGQFLYMNPGAEKIFGEEYVARRSGEWHDKAGTFFYPDRKTPIKNEDLPLARAILRGEFVDDEDVYIPRDDADGTCIRVSARPLLNDGDGVRKGVIVIRDVTEQLMAEEALTQAFAQGRLEIVETILHNIGNAINSVTIGIETVHRDLEENTLLRRLVAVADAVKAHREDWGDYIRNDPQGQQVLPFVMGLAEDFVRQRAKLFHTVDRVRTRARHIAEIVRTQKALGTPNVARKDICLEDAIWDAVRVLQESISKRAITVAVECEDAPQEIRTQESQFHQMLVNIIKNSIEAIDALAESGAPAKAPRIEVHAYVEGDFLNLDTTDNGIGIEAADSRLIFAAGYTTKKSGSGLGLHASANFVIGSGGQIHPLSDGIGTGTTMRVMLRLASISSVPSEAESENGADTIDGP